MISPTLVKYVLTAALRNRLLMVSFLMVITGGALSVFLGSSADIEADPTPAYQPPMFLRVIVACINGMARFTN